MISDKDKYVVETKKVERSKRAVLYHNFVDLCRTSMRGDGVLDISGEGFRICGQG